MWNKIAHIIIKFRLLLIISLVAFTLFLGYKSVDGIHMSYKFAKVVPQSDPEMQEFLSFLETFGKDDNIMAVSFKDSSIYTDLKKFTAYTNLCNDLSDDKGISKVYALPTLEKLQVSGRTFELQKIFDTIPVTEKELNAKIALTDSLMMFKNQIFSESGATLMLITVDPKVFDSKGRRKFIEAFNEKVSAFEKEVGIEAHYAGVPVVRAVVTKNMADELKMLLLFVLLAMAVILFLFFRSLYAVIFPVLVIGVSVVWVLGTLAFLGYEITLLTGLIPPIIVVIGIPNCIYLLNKYHHEYKKHNNQLEALTTVIKKIGIVTLITNLTTSIGFFVLMFNRITILTEFGIVAGINILATFVISMILIPSVFSYLPPPNTKQLKHLDFLPLKSFLKWLDFSVKYRRKTIYIVTLIIIIVSSYGASKIYRISYMVDDIPQDSKVKQDLEFFEDNFKGIMPLEIVIHPLKIDSETGDTIYDKNGFRKLKYLERMDRFEQFLSKQQELSTPISITTFYKAARQARYNDYTSQYMLPTRNDLNDILSRLKRMEGDNNELMQTFVDTTGQMRISLKVADIGSQYMDSLVHQVIEPEAERIFKDTATVMGKEAPIMDYTITGTTKLFIKGNQFLIKNLKQGLVIAFFVIALVMGILFRNVRVIIISLIPNIIPLLITGAMMGYFNIPLKPSTALIFTIAFGISVDDSIHFLAKYRQELFANNFSVIKSIEVSIRETGASMIYTSVILFCGFIIFTASDFAGTIMLGLLTSTTLLIAMFTNLILLPSLLITFDNGKRDPSVVIPIDSYKEEFDEEDEEFDAEKLEVNSNSKQSDSEV